jgi:dTMP kinase
MQQIQILANFIVLEGPDGAGTSTQLQLLDKKLRELQLPYICTYEPTNGFVGQQIRKILDKELNARPETLALLFAADRNEHLYAPVEGILTRLAQGKLVISDRYLFSSLAYQGTTCNFAWVQALNAHFPLPEYLIYINTPLKLRQQRLAARKHEELFDALKDQERITSTYEQVLALYKTTRMKIHILDGKLTPAEIFYQIWTILTSLPIISNV